MDATAATGGTDSHWSRLPIGELQAALGSNDSPESSDVDEVTPAGPLDFDGPPTDETAQRMLEHEAKLLKTMERLRRRKRQLRAKLAAYQRKEMEFVAQMDTHMDEVERTEHALTLRIEQLTTENNQLKGFTDKRSRDNAELADKLAETTKQCNESETRVQFLVDRIVALLSNASAQEQTDAIVKLRQREREMLQQLEETRAQYDEVRQQNGELTSRLTEELALSRRLSDQLAEVEERFFHNRVEQPPPSPCGSSDLAASLPPRAARGVVSERIPLAERVPSLPPGFPREDLAPLPEPLPLGKPCRPPSQLGVVHEGEPSSPTASPIGFMEMPSSDQFEMSDGLEHIGDTSANMGSNTDDRQQANDAVDAGDGEGLQGLRHSRTAASADGLYRMEEKLRDALDRASFECAVVRVEPGVYSFGPSVMAVVELTPEGEAVASREGGPFQPIEDFIQCIARESSQAAENTQAASEPTSPDPQDPGTNHVWGLEPGQLAVGETAGSEGQTSTPASVPVPLKTPSAAQSEAMGSAETTPQVPPGQASSPPTGGVIGIAGRSHSAPRPTTLGRFTVPSAQATRVSGVRAVSPTQKEPPQGGRLTTPAAASAVAAAAVLNHAPTHGRTAAISQPMIANHLFSPRGPVAPQSSGGAPLSAVQARPLSGGASGIPAGPLVPTGLANARGSAHNPSPMRVNVAQSPARQWQPSPPPGVQQQQQQQHMHLLR